MYISLTLTVTDSIYHIKIIWRMLTQYSAIFGINHKCVNVLITIKPKEIFC